MLEYILFPEKKKKSKLNPTPRYIKFLSFSAVILASIVAGLDKIFTDNVAL